MLLALSALANVAFTLVLAAAFIALAIQVLRDYRLDAWFKPVPWRSMLQPVLPAVPLVAWLLIPILLLRKKKLLEIGGRDGFWPDTVGSLVDATLYEPSAIAAGGVALQAWVAICGAAGLLVLLGNGRHAKARAGRFVVTILLLVAFLSVVQHWLLGVAYLQGRRGLFLIPLLLLGALAATSLPWCATARWIVTVLLGGPMPLLVAHAAAVANRTHTFDWRYDAAGRRAMQVVAGWVASHPPPAPLRLRVDWMLEPSSTFYRMRFGLETVLARPDRSGIDGDCRSGLRPRSPGEGHRGARRDASFRIQPRLHGVVRASATSGRAHSLRDTRTLVRRCRIKTSGGPANRAALRP